MLEFIEKKIATATMIPRSHGEVRCLKCFRLRMIFSYDTELIFDEWDINVRWIVMKDLLTKFCVHPLLPI